LDRGQDAGENAREAQGAVDGLRAHFGHCGDEGHLCKSVAATEKKGVRQNDAPTIINGDHGIMVATRN
jgi:hypothetical protein